MPAEVDDALWAAVLAEAGIAPRGGPDRPADDIPLAELAGDEVGLLRLFGAVERRVAGGFSTDLLDVLVTFGDLAHFVAVRRSAEVGR